MPAAGAAMAHPSTTLTTSLVRPQDPSPAGVLAAEGRTCPRREEGTETGHPMIERRVGLAGPEPAPALGRMRAARGTRRGETRRRTPSFRVPGASGASACGSPPRRRVVVDERRAKFRRRVTLHVARRFSRPRDFGEVASRRLTPPHASRASAARADRVGRASIGVDLALARWVTTTARRGASPRAVGGAGAGNARSAPGDAPCERRVRRPARRLGRRRRALRVPPTRPSAFSGYGAFATSSRRATDTTPNTTGKDGRDRAKRQRTAGGTTWRAGATSTSAAQTSANLRPCLFWRQGLCKNGDKCGYVHGDSLVPCTQFASPGGCRFGDKCAFRHVPVPGSNPAPARTPSPAFLPPPPNPFATHASNCGCRLCRPSDPVKGGDEDEDGELVDAESARAGEGEGETSTREEDTRERDEVLARCAVIESPEMRRTWGKFAEGRRDAPRWGGGVR